MLRAVALALRARLRELMSLREIFLIAQPPLLIQGGEAGELRLTYRFSGKAAVMRQVCFGVSTLTRPSGTLSQRERDLASRAWLNCFTADAATLPTPPYPPDINEKYWQRAPLRSNLAPLLGN